MRKQSKNLFVTKNRSVQNYLDRSLYPTLQKAVDELLIELETKYYDDMTREFNKNFFENRAEILKKQKELYYLERDSDFSETEYDHYVKTQMELLKENEVFFDFLHRMK
jgi:tRNA pseudouridine-54 N-methylase